MVNKNQTTTKKLSNYQIYNTQGKKNYIGVVKAWKAGHTERRDGYTVQQLIFGF